MKKTELIKAVATKAEVSQKEVAAIIDALGATVEDVVKAGDTVTVLGAKFATKDVPAKSGVSTLSGTEKAWSTEAYTAVTVKPTKALKELLK